MVQSCIARLILAGGLAALAAGGVHADEPNHHHHKLAKDVDAFHAVLAPVWHARPGPERLRNACAKVEDMTRLANHIRSTNASRLVESVASLQTACQGPQGDVDGALDDVHEAFHHLINAKR